MPVFLNRPAATALYDDTLPERKVGIVTAAGRRPVLAWNLRTPAGRPVDLTPYGVGDPPAVAAAIRVREATRMSSRIFAFDAACTDPAAGRIEGQLDLAAIGGPGVYTAEVAALDAPGGAVVEAEQLTLIVEPGLFGDPGQMQGPPTVAEARLHLRDSSAAENRLLDSVQFDDAEIGSCLARAVDFWNESLPPIPVYYTTQDFPYRSAWLDALAAGLFRLLAEWHRKNKLSYQAGGGAATDHDQAPEYDARADALWQQYAHFVTGRKVAINKERAWGHVESPWRARPEGFTGARY